MKKLFFFLILLIPNKLFASCNILYHPTSASSPSRITSYYYVCDLDSEKPNATDGDMAIAKDTGYLYVWRSGSWGQINVLTTNTIIMGGGNMPSLVIDKAGNLVRGSRALLLRCNAVRKTNCKP